MTDADTPRQDAKQVLAAHSSGEDSDADPGNLGTAIVATCIVTIGALTVCGTVTLVALLAQKTWGADGLGIRLQAHYLAYAIIIALANNVDNLGARIAYSIQGTKVDFIINLWISVITFLISSLAAVSGAAVIDAFGKMFASVIATAMLASLGMWIIIETLKQSWHEKIHEEKTSTHHFHIFRKPHHADIDDSKHIDFKEGTFLGVALSLNNIGGGVSAGVLGINPILVGFLSALVSFIALLAGNHLADFFIEKHIADRAAVVGGVLLILIGIKQVI